MNFIAALIVSALLFSVSRGFLPLWGAMVVLWVWWHVMLAPQTWMEFLAGMNIKRMEGDDDFPLAPGVTVLPADPDEWCNEPDGIWVANKLLWPGAALDNFLLAQYAAIFYFRVAPIPWRDVGLTKLLNRLSVRQDAVGARALAVRKRWLSRYDPRGLHT